MALPIDAAVEAVSALAKGTLGAQQQQDLFDRLLLDDPFFEMFFQCVEIIAVQATRQSRGNFNGKDSAARERLLSCLN
jgi:hypothetical protein